MPRCNQSGCFSNSLDGKQYCGVHHKDQAGYTYGLDHDLQQKQKSKWDDALAKNVQIWIEACTAKRFPTSDMQASLKSGVLLCELINSIWPNTIKKINSGAMPFVQRENVAQYLSAVKAKGVRETDLFMTEDLFEGNNMVQVVQNLCALGIVVDKIANYRGPKLVTSGGAVSTQALSTPSYKSNSTPATNNNNAYSATPTYAANKAPTPAAAPAPVSAPAPAAASSGPKFCSECGAKNSGGKFCAECGHKY